VVLGWPPVVAGLLLAVEGGLEPASVCVWPWLTVAALAVAAALLVALALAAAAARIDAETTLAWAAGLVILALLSLPQAPALLSLPSSPAPATRSPGWQPGDSGHENHPAIHAIEVPALLRCGPRLAW
jgi:hypothetical protein